jgi:Pyridoxamine 5'-phosphate oxidase
MSKRRDVVVVRVSEKGDREDEHFHSPEGAAPVDEHARVRALFDAHRHKTIATLRADGSPRISGSEAVFEDGELVFGSMPNARKGADLRRDPRFALHSATVDPVEGSETQWPGEAKISGRAIAAGPVTEGADGDRFHADIAEVVQTHLNEDATMLVAQWWTPADGLRRIERE